MTGKSFVRLAAERPNDEGTGREAIRLRAFRSRGTKASDSL